MACSKYARVLFAMILIYGIQGNAADSCFEYGDRKEYDKAIEECTKALASRESPANYHDRGRAYFAKGEYDKAISDYTKSIEIFSKNAAVWINRGIAHRARGDYDRSLVDCSRAIAIDPQNSDAWLNRGMAYHAKGKYYQAIEDYNRAYEKNPKDANVLSCRGVAYYAMDERDKASADFRSAINLDQKNPSPYYNLAWFYANDTNAVEACNWLKIAIEKGYDNWNSIKKDKNLDNIRDAICYKEIMSKK